MDYFKDVYLKRINKFGNNIQDRIHGRMTRDFENKLKKSVNTLDLYEEEYSCVPFTQGIVGEKAFSDRRSAEKKMVNYLFVRHTDNFDNGFCFYAQRPYELRRQMWMIFFKEQHQTIGYNRYQILLLDHVVEWIDKQGHQHKSPAHYVGELDNQIRAQFKINYDAIANIPSRILELSLPAQDTIKKGTKFNIHGSTWNVEGYDNISIPGVMYVTLRENYTQDTTIADEERLLGWSIDSFMGADIKITNAATVSFCCYYNGAMVEEQVELQCDDLTFERLGPQDFKVTGLPGTYTITASLAAAPLVSKQFDLTIAEESADWLALVGPSQIRVAHTVEYTINSNILEYEFEVAATNGYATIDKIDGNKIYITGKQIGKDNIVITYNNTESTIPVEIISAWM